MEPLTHTEILAHILPILNEEEAERKIRQLEAGLASGAMWCHDRIQFFEQSDPKARDIARDCHEAMVYQISLPRMRQIVARGLTQAWRDGIVSTEEIGAFADDIASLQVFNSILLEESAENFLSPIWEHAFDLPPGVVAEICGVDLQEIFEEADRHNK